MATEQRVTIHTDGSCLGNPGPGGWAAILEAAGADGRPQCKELSGGYRLTTNNRMELLAVIEALTALKVPCAVQLYTDSQYVRNAIEQRWLAGWQRKGWMTASKTPVKNQDMWQRLVPLLAYHTVRFHWVRGHSGHAVNERCDVLAKAAAMSGKLLVDEGYRP